MFVGYVFSVAFSVSFRHGPSLSLIHCLFLFLSFSTHSPPSALYFRLHPQHFILSIFHNTPPCLLRSLLESPRSFPPVTALLRILFSFRKEHNSLSMKSYLFAWFLLAATLCTAAVSVRNWDSTADSQIDEPSSFRSRISESIDRFLSIRVHDM